MRARSNAMHTLVALEEYGGRPPGQEGKVTVGRAS